MKSKNFKMCLINWFIQKIQDVLDWVTFHLLSPTDVFTDRCKDTSLCKCCCNKIFARFSEHHVDYIYFNKYLIFWYSSFADFIWYNWIFVLFSISVSSICSLKFFFYSAIQSTKFDHPMRCQTICLFFVVKKKVVDANQECRFEFQVVCQVSVVAKDLKFE